MYHRGVVNFVGFLFLIWVRKIYHVQLTKVLIQVISYVRPLGPLSLTEKSFKIFSP